MHLRLKEDSVYISEQDEEINVDSEYSLHSLKVKGTYANSVKPVNFVEESD
jgi:hypothetical protein